MTLAGLRKPEVDNALLSGLTAPRLVTTIRWHAKCHS